MNNLILMATTTFEQSLRQLENILNGIGWAYIIIILIELICIIVTAVNTNRIYKHISQPFQNKKPEYPDKVIELLQTIVSAEQHNTEEVHKLQSELSRINNGGIAPGMKSTETANQEQIIKLLKQQNDILLKLLEATNGEEKKKLMEKLKQAQDIMNNI